MLAPRANPDLLGHAEAERRFLDAWASGRVGHAWLISGPRGIGKATFAYRIARFALAGQTGTDMFGQGGDLALSSDHPVFRRVASAGHADLRIVERGWADERKSRRRGEITVDDVRGVGDFLALTPAEGGWRVVIIDAADEMNANAANAVLKTLEEPPRNSLILLVSHSPGRLLPTIRSRCRRLLLRPLPDTLVLDLLERLQPTMSGEDRAVLARLSGGSIGRATILAEEGGLDLYRQLTAILDTLPHLDVPTLHAFADRVARSDADNAWRTVTDLLEGWLMRLIRAGGRGDSPQKEEMVAGEGKTMAALLSVAGVERWLEVWEKVSALFARADAVNLDRKQALLTAFLALERLAGH